MLKKKFWQSWRLYRKNIRFALLIFVEILLFLFAFSFFKMRSDEVRQAKKLFSLFDGTSYYGTSHADIAPPYGVIYRVILGDEKSVQNNEDIRLIGYSGQLEADIWNILNLSYDGGTVENEVLQLWLPRDGFLGYHVGQSVFVPITERIFTETGNTLHTVWMEAYICGVYHGQGLLTDTMSLSYAVLAANPEIILKKLVDDDICEYIYGSEDSTDSMLDLDRLTRDQLTYLQQREKQVGSVNVFLLVLCLSGWLGFELVFFANQEKQITIYLLCGADTSDVVKIYLIMHVYLIGLPLLVGIPVVLMAVSFLGLRISLEALLGLGCVFFLFFMLLTVMIMKKSVYGDIAQKTKQFL